MKIYAISFTPNGDILNSNIKSRLSEDDVSSCLRDDNKTSLSERTGNIFYKCDAVIFIGAVGIAVRAIAPYIKNKAQDPAVVVCDELGKYVIPILSGHMGGANALACKIAKSIGAEPVITTATDINNVWAVDNWAVENKYKILNTENIKYISAALLRGENVGMVSDICFDTSKIPSNVIMGSTDTKCGIVLSPYVKNIYKHTLNLIPKCIYAGVGSKRDADEYQLIELLKMTVSKSNIDIYSIKGVATIDIKSNEKSISRLCEYLKTDLKCYSAKTLNFVNGDFTKSDFVKQITGTDNVCERSAAAASCGRIIVPKTIGEGVTLALALERNDIP